MTETLWAAVISGCFGIIGVLIGFVLGKIAWGFLYVKVEAKDKDLEIVKEIVKQKIKLNFGFYNASGKNKVISNLKLLFINSKKSLPLAIPIKDLKTLQSQVVGYTIQTVGINNILPKTGLDIEGQFELKEDELAIAKQAKKIYIQYQNDKFETVEKKLSATDFSRLIEFLNKD